MLDEKKIWGLVARVIGTLRMVPTNTDCAVYDYVGKADLSKAYWNPKINCG